MHRETIIALIFMILFFTSSLAYANKFPNKDTAKNRQDIEMGTSNKNTSIELKSNENESSIRIERNEKENEDNLENIGPIFVVPKVKR